MNIRLRLAHKVLLGFLLVGLLPMATGAYLLSRQLERYQHDTTQALAQARAQRVGDRLALKVGSIIEGLQFLQRYLHVTEADQALLQRAHDRYPELLRLTVTDLDDRVVTALFRYGFKARGSQMQPVDFYDGDEFRISFVQWHLEPQLRVHFPVMELVSGKRIGTLHAEIGLKGLFSELPAVGGSAGDRYIVSDQGRVVSHANINHVLSSLDLSTQPVVQALKEGAGFATAEYPGLDGRRVLGVGMQVPGLPLFVVEEVPLEQAYAPSRELTRRVIVALGGAMLLLLVMAVLLSRKITRPLEQLEQGTRRVGQGDLDFTIGRIPHLISDELDDLAQRFDAMVKALKRDRYSREQAEQKLRQLQSYLSNIINSMPSVLIGVDSALQVTQWNQEAEKISGVDANRAMGRPLAEVFPRMEASLDKVRRAIREHAPLLESKVDESRDGDVHYSDITIYPLVTDGVKGVVIRIDDVTDQVRIEEMMIQSEKMLTVAGLAAGMAHEINNPLAGILQNTQVIRNRMGLELERNREQARACGVSMEQVDCYLRKRDLPRLLSAVEESGQRAARIVTNMLSFSRNSSSAFVAVDLNELLEKSVELAASDYDLRTHYDIRQVVIRRDYAPDLPSVICDAGKIQQVFLNLLKNGAQAALEQADPPDDPHLTLRTRQEGEWVQVEIEDNGPGMPEAVRRHVFEPFFTTKKVGIGTGLGLSVSYFIIHENHGGTLMVESEPGRGSRFIVCLPLVGIGRP